MRSRSFGWPGIAALVLGVALLAAPAPARACSFVGTPPPPPPDHTDLHWAAAFGVGGSLMAAVIVSQAAMGEEMFPDWAAALELGLGVAHTVGGLVLPFAAFATVSPGDSCRAGPDVADEAVIGMGLLVSSGGWLIAHAIWSFFDVDALPAAMPTFSVGPDGAMLQLIGSF